MLYLLGSILFTSYLLLSFKVIEKYKLNTFHVIVCNYITCVITGCVVNRSLPINSESLHSSWFVWALLMGVLFISLFNMMGYTAQKVSVAVAAVSNKLSMVIPFLFSIYLYNEVVGRLKIAGVLVALIAVYCTLIPAKSKDEILPKKKNALLLPIVLFIGSGLLDTLVKYVQQQYLNASNSNSYLIVNFLTAAIIGMAIMMYQIGIQGVVFSYKTILAGVAIGVPNYFSIWFLVNLLKAFPNNSSSIIPINNIGIVLVGAVGAGWLFKEKLLPINWVGIALSVLAIALIAYG
jgi:drug/metabolite transporter (DMT)-like permease